MPEEFGQFVARGGSQTVQPLNKFGRNPVVDAAAVEDVWDAGGSFTYQAVAVPIEIVSASANDAAAGTGARTVQVFGTDGNYLTISEIVTMNGATPVTLTQNYSRIWRAIVRTVGTGGVNAGIITIRVVTGPVTQAQILAGNGQTLMALFTVPSNQFLIISNYYTTMALTGGGNNIVNVKLFVRPRDESWILKHTLDFDSQTLGHINYRFTPALSVGSCIDVRLEADTTTNSTVVSAGFGGYLYAA